MDIQEPLPQKPDRRLATWQFVGLMVFIFLLGAGVSYIVWAYPLQVKVAALENTALQAQSVSATQAAAQSAVQIPKDVKRYDIPVDDDAILGPADAPITLIEFSDYQCPYCRKWQIEVFPRLQQQYGDKIRFVYRDFPLYESHPDAEPAALAADCAGEQNKYWDFHNLLFNGESLGQPIYEAYAEKLNLNTDQFKACVSEQRYKSEVKADFDFASNLGVSSTPTFFINGLAVVGAQPYEVFSQVIDLELAGQIPH